MKIAMMTNNYKPFLAGVPISVERLTESLRSRGHQVVVFAPSYDGQQAETDIVRYRSLLKNIACGFSVPDCLDPVIEKEFREGEFDVIHVHHPMMIGNMAEYLSKKYEVPLVFTYHTKYEQYLHYIGLSALREVIPAYIRQFTKRCDLVIAPTPQMKQHLMESDVETGISVLPTGIPEGSFSPDEKSAEEIREKILGGRKYLFCSVARLAKEKNIAFLIRSMKGRKEKCGGDFKLLLIGEGPYRQHLEELVKELDLTDEIVFAGSIPNQEIKNYCRAGDMFLFASESETQGIVLLEAMAAGTPVLAVRATGTEDIVTDGVNGYMTEASEAEFTEKLMDILEKKELEILRSGALDTAGKYTCEKIGKRAAEIYEEAVRERREKIRWKNIRHRKNRRSIIYVHG